MKAIGSLILKVLTVIFLVILIGILAMVLAVMFNGMSILSGVLFTSQYNAYGASYNSCLSSANVYGFNSSVCNELFNVTNNTKNLLLWTGSYSGTFSNPIVWAIIFVILTAGLYVVSLQGLQFGQNIVIVNTKRKRR